MSTFITLKGRALYCKPWPSQIDRAFSDPTEPRDRGGNWSTGLVIDDSMVKLFKATGTKARVNRVEDMKKLPEPFDGSEKYISVRRYEKLSNQTAITDGVKVTGVDEGVAIGNGSDVTLVIERYTTEYKDKPIVGLRWVSVHVDNLIEYKKPEPAVVDDNSPPVH